MLLIMMLAAAVVLATRLLLHTEVMKGTMALGMGDAPRRRELPEW